MTEKDPKEQIREWARDAKVFCEESAERDEHVPTDELIMRATVAYHLLARRGYIATTGSDMDRSHAIAIIASSYVPEPGTHDRAELFATVL